MKNLTFLQQPVRLLAFISFLALSLWACTPPESREQTEQGSQTPSSSTLTNMRDQHSFARPEEAKMRHLYLSLKVDFEQKKLSGTARIDFDRTPEAKSLWLDTKGLQITGVTAEGQPIPFRLHEELPYVGSALEIELGPDTKSVLVAYSTSPDAAALQWFTSAQTLGKRKPFLFTQSQCILARSWVPCQDSPGIRFTYEAQVQVPTGMMALMSASNPQEKSEDGRYQFSMDQPVPAYLLALAAGDLAFKPLGSMTGIYAEPELIEKAAYEFADTEKMVQAAAGLYGPYQWGRYDLLVLPPSFPFGGMENPRLTFVTPTILAGDRSLTSLIAHELAHSWSGNLVTNATWEDFWLNEGFTVYFENRIMEKVYGTSTAEMLALIEFQELQEGLERMNYGPDTRLKLDLNGRDPDDAVSPIAYNKGYMLLRLIEETVGRAAFDAFLKAYFQEFAFRSINTEMFLAYLRENLLSKFPGSEEKIRLDEWVYSPGLPDNHSRIRSERFDAAEAAVQQFLGGTPASGLNAKDWTFQQWVHFLGQLPAEISPEQLAGLDAAFRFSESKNVEILFKWLSISLQARYTPAYPAVERFLVSVGRRKFVSPLFRQMAAEPSQHAMAASIYRKARPGYHYVTINTIDGILETAGVKWK